MTFAMGGVPHAGPQQSSPSLNSCLSPNYKTKDCVFGHILYLTLSPSCLYIWVGPFEIGPVVSVLTSISFSWGGTEDKNAFSIFFWGDVFSSFSIWDSKHCNYSLELCFFTLLGILFFPEKSWWKLWIPVTEKMHAKYQKQLQQYHFSLEAHPRVGLGVKSLGKE